MATGGDEKQVPWTIQGKVVLITGANTGIGYETALEIAKRGAKKVILACRNVDLAGKAIEEIKKVVGGSNHCELASVQLDLSSLESVRKCAQHLLDNEPVLNVLINNAGVHATNEARQVTADGFELTFHTNHLGHFLLTNLLLPLLKRSKPSRIVVVASMAYQFCWPSGLTIDDLNAERPGKYDAFNACRFLCFLFIHFLNSVISIL